MPKDCAQGLCPRTVPKDCAHGLCPRTVPTDCAQGLCPRTVPRTVPKDCDQGPCSKAVPKGCAQGLCPRAVPKNCAKELCPRAVPSAQGLCLRAKGYAQEVCPIRLCPTCPLMWTNRRPDLTTHKLLQVNTGRWSRAKQSSAKPRRATLPHPTPPWHAGIKRTAHISVSGVGAVRYTAGYWSSTPRSYFTPHPPHPPLSPHSSPPISPRHRLQSVNNGSQTSCQIVRLLFSRRFNSLTMAT